MTAGITTAAALSAFRDELTRNGFTVDEAHEIVVAATAAEIQTSGLTVVADPATDKMGLSNG